jgi:predicted transcriptional regulator
MDLSFDDTGGSGGTEHDGTSVEAAIGDVAFLTRSGHRVSALVALAERPRSRAALRELTGVSASTIGRTLGEFERRNWIRRDGHEYEATQLGAFVAAAMREVT